MGLFDFLRRKESQPNEIREHLAQPRLQHYMMAHVALRSLAFENPLAYLGILGSPDANMFFAQLMESVSEQCPDEPDPGYRPDEISVHCLRVHSFPCAIVQMPSPKATTEAFFTAAVLMHDPSHDIPEPTQMKLRYLTLEKGFHADGTSRTVLCEWTSEGSHLNFGDGPPPELKLFINELEKAVDQTQGDAVHFPK